MELSRDSAAAGLPASPPDPAVVLSPAGNGHASLGDLDPHALLEALQAVRIGDFSVRLSRSQTGLAGKIADTFNEIVAANQRMAQQLEHVGQLVGREGRTRFRAKLGMPERRLGRDGGLCQPADRRPAVADHGGHPGDQRGRPRRPAADGAAGGRWQAVAGRVSSLRENRQHHDQAAFRLHVRGDARRPRGRHRRQARRPGAGARGERGVEGADGERQLDGLQPDRAGAQHRRRDHRGCQRRSVEEDHRRCAGRDPAAQGSHQHDGRSVALVRLRGDARRPRGRHRGQAGRAGDRARGGGHLEGSDRQRQCDVRQPDRPGAQHRPGDHGGRARRSVAQDHRRRPGRDSGAEGHHQHDGRSAQRLRLRSDARGARGGHRRAARRPGAGAGCRRHLEGPDRQRQLDGLQPDWTGPQHRRGLHGNRARRSVEEDHRQRLRRDPAVEGDHQHDGRSAQRLRLRGHPRGPRGRNRRATGRAGQRARRGRHLEGPDRQRQLHGRQPDRAGAQHRRGGHRNRQRRPVAQDHRERQRRNPAAEGDHQHDGRSAQPLRRRSDPGGARGRHRRPAGRPGAGVGRRGDLEGPHRQRELDGLQPHRPGAQYRRGRDRGRARRPVAQDHGRCARRDHGAEGHHQHDGRSAQCLRLRGHARRTRGGHRRAARRPGAGAGRRRHLEGPDRQRQFDGRQPDRAGAQHRRSGDRNRQRRSVAQDHRRRARRNPAAQGNAEHDGRSAQPVRR